jgi:hypothetical protein
MLRNRRVRQIVAVFTLSVFSTACYVQRPMTTSVPPIATRIVALVTDTGAVMMSNAIGAGAVEIEGIVVDADAESWKLQMVRVDQRGGFSTRWNREVVTFPRMALTNAQQRVLDKKRSWMLAGLAIVAVLSSMLFYSDAIGGGNDEVPPPPPQ